MALEIIDFFQLSTARALVIKDEVLASVSQWREQAHKLGIGRNEQQQMEPAFNVG